MRPLIIVILSCFLTVGCATARFASVQEDSRLGKKDEKILESAAEEQAFLERSGILYEDEKFEDYLEQIVARLRPSGVQEKTNFRVKIIKDPHLNAFVLPNGTIYLHTGILARLDNESQLAALLSHEMTHVLKRHIFLSPLGGDGRGEVAQSSSRALDRLGKIGDFLSLLGSIGTMVVLSGYAQELETEADLVGMTMMSDAGYDPEEVLRLFDHLKREIEEEHIKEPFFFGTHPSVDRRIENCRNFLESSLENRMPLKNNQKGFFARLERIILDNALLDLRAGRYESARRSAAKVLETGQNDARAYFIMGEIYRQRGGEGDFKRAKTFYEKAIAIDPHDPAPQQGIGLIYYKEGEWALARQFFESCLALSPHLPERAYIEGYLKKCIREGLNS